MTTVCLIYTGGKYTVLENGRSYVQLQVCKSGGWDASVKHEKKIMCNECTFFMMVPKIIVFNTTQCCKGGYHYMLLATLAIAVIRAEKSF